jgi:hypothetical protein
MEKQSATNRKTHSWVVYRLRGTPAQLIGIVYHQPDEQAAIKKAIEEFNVPPDQQDELIAWRRE